MVLWQILAVFLSACVCVICWIVMINRYIETTFKPDEQEIQRRTRGKPNKRQRVLDSMFHEHYWATFFNTNAHVVWYILIAWLLTSFILLLNALFKGMPWSI